jgi:MFS family permease
MRRLLFLVGAIVLVDTMFFAALTPLLRHYVDELDLGKAGAGVLQAMYPAGALVAGIPGGIAAARLGVKPTVLIGLTLLAATTVAFGFANSVLTLDVARFLQGISSAFSWTGALSWLVAASPPGRRGQLIGSAFGAAIAGALFGPVLGAVASFTGTATAFSVVAGLAIVLAAWALRTPAATPAEPQPVRMLFRALKVRSIQIPIWLCLLPALLFGNLSVLAPLRLSHLGWGAAAIGGTYLVMAAIEASWAPLLGRASDHFGRMPPLRAALVASAIVTLLLPWPRSPWLLALVIVCAGFAFGSFWTPAMSMVTDEAENFGLDYGYAFALVNVAWAPGQAGGAALGGAVASVTSDAVPYLALTAVCVLTLVTVTRLSPTRPSGTARRSFVPARARPRGRAAADPDRAPPR